MFHRFILASAIAGALLAAAPAQSQTQPTGGLPAPALPATPSAVPVTNPALTGEQLAEQALIVKRTATVTSLAAKHDQLAGKLSGLSGRPATKARALSPQVAADAKLLLKRSRTLRKQIRRLRDRIRYFESGDGQWERLRQQIPAEGRAWLDKLGGCEADTSGGYTANTGNGYLGRYQFDPGTWKATKKLGLPAPTGPPHKASPAEQDVRAWKLRLAEGTGHWPVCG